VPYCHACMCTVFSTSSLPGGRSIRFVDAVIDISMIHILVSLPCLALDPAFPASRENAIRHHAPVAQPSKVLRIASSNTFGLSSSSLLASANWESQLSTIKTEKDEVVRVLDANTVKMQKSGLVTMALAKTPSGYNKNDAFPDCMSKSPSSKIRKLLPKGTKVGIRFVDEVGGGSNGRPREALVIVSRQNEEPLLVNSELIRTGFAKPSARGKESSEILLPGISEGMQHMQADAKERGLGMYTRCENAETISLEDQFEEMAYTVTTQYGDDGGKQVIVKRNDGVQEKPKNPGDTKGCSDFETYEESLRYYERYLPYYGDVARLDRDGDGIPCPGLPHTADQSQYRMKVPTKKAIEKEE
jgi:hypothetical protein